MFFGLAMFRALLFALLIVAVIKLLRRGRLGPVGFAPRGSGTPGGHPHGWAAHRPAEDAAFETLRMRLANGDITPEEYLERSSVLRTPQDPRE